MKFDVPEIPEAECTPLVVRLLEIIRQMQERIQVLEDEIAQLKGLKTRPKLSPSCLEQPRGQTAAEGQTAKRPGSSKRPKTTQLTIHRDVVVPVREVPPGSTFKGYEDFVVQDLVIRAENTRYRRERWLTPDGRTLTAELPAEARLGHFGADLTCFIIHQYHHQHVTQPLLWEQLQQYGIDISIGQLSRILTEDKDGFHQEKEELLPIGLQVSAYVGVDDTGARHQGRNGYCTNIGNDLFAYFESTDSKSRLNFLEILRRPHTDYVINEMALAYWERQKLPAELVQQLSAGPQQFADAAAWHARLAQLGITAERHVRGASEGALLGSLIAHGVSPNLRVLSDGAPQFDVLVHAACWIHAERPLARLIPYSDQHRAAIENIRDQIWKLYQDLKAYRQRPDPGQVPALTARFEALVEQKTGFPSVDGVLKDMRERQADLLRVLQCPQVPLHNNGRESDIRDYVKKRKISGSTRSDSGRRCRDTFASLKKTCRKLGVNFWHYLQDRIRGLGRIPRLAELIQQKAVASGGGVTAAPAY